MTVEYVDCEQGSDAWHRARMSIVTASKLSVVMSSPSGRPGTMPGRTRYLHNLAAEILIGEPNMSDYKNVDMARGNTVEPILRGMFEIIDGRDTKQVGFVRNDGLIKGRVVGCSPDSLIGDDGVLELKSQQPDLLIEQLKAGTVPTEHRAQLYGSMWVTERKFCVLAIGWPKMPLFLATIKRDEMEIAKIRMAVELFYTDLDKLVDWLRKYR